MISAQMIIDKLKADCTALAFVGGAGAFANAADQLKTSKSAFVMPPTESAAPNATGTEVTRQRSEVRVRVMLGFLVRSATGADQSGDVDQVREAVKTCLIGWSPDGGIHAPFGLVGFAATSVSPDGASIFYALDLRTFYIVRALPS